MEKAVWAMPKRLFCALQTSWSLCLYAAAPLFCKVRQKYRENFSKCKTFTTPSNRHTISSRNSTRALSYQQVVNRHGGADVQTQVPPVKRRRKRMVILHEKRKQNARYSRRSLPHGLCSRIVLSGQIAVRLFSLDG